ncbi:hypothetical protein PISMIDRAFT_688366 [Pisolithus microcarpus 441]|uniref:G domain-containing protein n=1 Tax=Pisolithus microcarpus 441 TaxID=765257 RepID=A0A0C9Z1N5_9AGAM|nr:hypothetical protein PISMIDRAFT_688366 [Pisolithus microcarpus 441]
MAPGCFSGFWCWRRPPSPSDDRTVSPVPAPTRATRPDAGSPSDNRGIHGATAVEINRPGTPPGPEHVEVPLSPPTQGSLPSGILTPALTDVQPTGPNRPEGSVDVPVHAQAEKVPPGSPSSRPPYRLDPAKAKEHVDRIRRFRILVMGRANAGKTTILQRVCNTTDQPEIFNGKGEKVNAAVVQGSLTRGHHNIEDELVFKSNPGFVFHDSCGFESGSEEQFDLMKKFVRDRAKTTQLNERIHAIWFCIPLNESHRMVMAAERKFFEECDTGYVPAIVLLTKADTLSLEAVQELMGQGMSVGDAVKGAVKVEEKMLHDCLERVKGWLNEKSFPPKDYLSLTGMQQEGAECTPLLTCTANALKETGLQQLLISTQQSNMELCMEFAIMNPLKRCIKKQDNKIQPAHLAFPLSIWFPFDPIAQSGQPLTMPTLSSSMQYSRQYYAEHGLGSILVFEYLYFLLQVPDGRNNMQDCLTLAVKEYQGSGIHTKVNESIQKAFEKCGDNMDALCPILVHIAKENQLSKILTRKD